MKILSVILILVLGQVLANATPLPMNPNRPRYVVLTDISGDPDDQQSLIRLLLYSNEFDLQGICVSPFEGKQATGLKAVDEVLTNYGKVRSNLALHADGFPTEAEVRSLVKAGHDQADYTYMGKDSFWNHIGKDKATPASDWILSLLEMDDARPIYFGVWGGPVNFAQALFQLAAKYPPEKAAEMKRKIRVYDISTQDNTSPLALLIFVKRY